MLPPDWEMHDLSVLADYRAGRTPPRANPIFWEGDSPRTPWVAISDMTEHGVVSNTSETVTQAAYDTVFRGRLSKAGTLLMSFKLTIGRISTLGLDAFHNEAIISIFPKYGVDQRFLGYWLSQVDYDGLHDRQIKGNTLNQDKIDRIAVAKPPLPEQQNIADVLDHVRQGIETQRAQFKIATELKRAVMGEVFTRGLRGEAQKDSEIGPVPESWEVKSLAELCTISSGGTPRKSVAEYWDGTIPWVSGKDLKLPVLDDVIDHISEEGASNGSKIAPADAVLILVRGMGLAKDLPVARITRPMAFNQDLKALVSRGAVSGSYLRSAIYDRKGHLLSRIVPSAHGTMTLNLDDLENFKIACPSDAKQQSEITAILDAIDAKIDLHKRKKLVLEQLFRALLHKLMTGSIRAADLDLSALDGEVTE